MIELTATTIRRLAIALLATTLLAAAAVAGVRGSGSEQAASTSAVEQAVLSNEVGSSARLDAWARQALSGGTDAATLEIVDNADETVDETVAAETDELDAPAVGLRQDPQGPDNTPSFTTATEIIAGRAGTPDMSAAADPQAPIGQIAAMNHVPDGIDLTSFPGVPAPQVHDWGGPQSFSAGKGCHVQCITSGLAYPRGFGAELVVETDVPANIWISVIGSHGGSSQLNFTRYTQTGDMVHELSWALDDLESSTTYYVTVAATDENGKTSHRWGEFRTLSKRIVYVGLESTTVSGGPDDVWRTEIGLAVMGGLRTAWPPGKMQTIDWLGPNPVHLDLEVRVTRFWRGDSCLPFVDLEVPQGHAEHACVAWNSAFESGIAVDVPPSDGPSRWTAKTINTSIQSPAGHGSLPGDQGDPYHFHFETPVVIHVVYS